MVPRQGSASTSGGFVSEQVAVQRLRRFAAALLLALATGCGGDTSGPPATTAVVDLQAGEFRAFAGNAISGAIAFPAAGAAGAQWLVVGQLVSGKADMGGTVRLGGASVVAGGSPLASAARALNAADRFHLTMRTREAALASELQRNPFLRAVPSAPQAPPQVGDRRAFKVCSDLDCNTLKTVTATAQWVGQHAAIFVDDTVPAGGFAGGDLDEIGTQFDDVLYPINVARFGAESDIDGNGVVVVLLTDAVNALIGRPDCSTAFVTGFFYGADLAPGLAGSHNNGEVFYGMVPDPGGQVACSYSTALVKRIMPVTFIHEFQHMISFNQKVLLRGSQSEVLWLNEALSHLAEELGSRHYDSLGDQTWRTRFQIGNLYNAYQYLEAPHQHYLIVTDAQGTLEERGAGWLFVRWLLDRYGENVAAALVQTPLLGVLAVQQATGGTPIESLLTRWGLALFVSDLPGFTPPAGIAYTSWRFRTTYASLHQQDPLNFPRAFPLAPDSSAGASVLLTGTLRSGSGAYVQPRQGANGDPFSLTFSVGTNASAGPQVTVLRLH
jgi:hypothetical protein